MEGMPPSQKVIVCVLAFAAVVLAVARCFASSQDIVAFLGVADRGGDISYMVSFGVFLGWVAALYAINVFIKYAYAFIRDRRGPVRKAP
jgi:hypothetical protein